LGHIGTVIAIRLLLGGINFETAAFCSYFARAEIALWKSSSLIMPSGTQL